MGQIVELSLFTGEEQGGSGQMNMLNAIDQQEDRTKTLRHKTHTFYSDAGHGWLEADLADLSILGISHTITGFSYRHGDKVYLEEDMDASTYINALFPNRNTDPEWPVIITDETGQPKVYETLVCAKIESDMCQNGQVVAILEEPPAPYFTPEEAEGKWICAFDTMCGGWDCVRYSDGEKDGLPVLYSSKEEVEADDFFELDDDFAIPATEFIEGRKAIFGGTGLRIEGTPIVMGYKIEGQTTARAEEPKENYNKIIPVAKAWQSNEYFPDDVDIIELILDFKDRLRLMEAMEKCKLYGYDYIAMRAGRGARLLSHDGELSEMRTDVEYFKCFKNGIYFYAQSKYDASCQIESELIIITEGLGIELPDHAEYEVPQQ